MFNMGLMPSSLTRDFDDTLCVVFIVGTLWALKLKPEVACGWLCSLSSRERGHGYEKMELEKNRKTCTSQESCRQKNHAREYCF